MTSFFMILQRDWAGWILFGLSFLFIFLYSHQRECRKVVGVLLFILTAHQMIAILTAYDYNHFFHNPDTVHFTNFAHKIARTHEFSLLVGADNYSQLLAVFYLLNDSLFFIQEVSLWVFLISCITLLKLGQLLVEREYKPYILLCCGLWPTVLFHATLPMRDGWELMFLLVSLYNVVFIFKSGEISVSRVAICFVSAIFMGLLHGGLMLCTFLLMCCFGILFLHFYSEGEIWIKGWKWIQRRSWYTQLIFLGIVLLLLIAFGYVSQIGLHKFVSHRNHLMSRIRGHYDYHLNFSYNSLLSGIQGIEIYVAYLFGPFYIHNLTGFVLFLLSKIRLILIIFSIKFLMQKKHRERQAVFALLYAYFVVSFIFSLGTANYGTAFRHNILTDWVIMLLGVPEFKNVCSGVFRRAYRKTSLSPPVLDLE